MFQRRNIKATVSCSPSRPSFRPTIEQLETRECLSVSVGLVGNTLNIVGTDSANNVAVAMVYADRIVDVVADGVHYQFSSFQVQKINIDLRGGDDTLNVRLGFLTDPSATMTNPKDMKIALGDGMDLANFGMGGLNFPNRVLAANLTVNLDAGTGVDRVIANFGEVRRGNLNFNASMGTGDDRAFVGMCGNIGAGTTALINLQGDQDADTLETWANYNGGYAHVNVANGGLLDINMSGGAGTDTLRMTYGGQVQGKMRIRLDGGADADTLNADILFQPGSTGSVDAALLGGDGGDALNLEVYGDANVLGALIDGGRDLDHATKIGTQVQIVNCE